MSTQHAILQDIFYALDQYISAWRAWCPRFLWSHAYQNNHQTIQTLKTQLKSIHIFSFQNAQAIVRRYLPVIESAISDYLNQQVLKSISMAEHYTRKIHLGKTMACLLSAYCSLNPSDTERSAFITHISQMAAFKRLKQSHPGIASKVLYRLYGSLGLPFDEYLRKVKYQASTRYYDPTDSKARAILSIYRY